INYHYKNKLKSYLAWSKEIACVLLAAWLTYSINTVTKLLVEVGQACSEYQDKALRNLPCKHVQVDEVWAFCYAKQKNVVTASKAVEGAGDICTGTATCADTKLIPSWAVGNRDAETAKPFIEDLASRLKNKIRLTNGFSKKAENHAHAVATFYVL